MAYMDPSQFGQYSAAPTSAGGSYFDPSGMGAFATYKSPYSASGDWLYAYGTQAVNKTTGQTAQMLKSQAAKYVQGQPLSDADAAWVDASVAKFGGSSPSTPAAAPSSGFDFSSGTNSGTAGSLNAQWEAGVDNVPAADAVASRAAAQAAIQGGQSGSFSTLAKANMAKWDAYVAKSAALSKLTADQYAQYQAGGSYDASTGTVSLTGGGSGGGGGILSIFQGAKPAAASAASVAGAVTGGGQGSYFGAPKPASGTGPDTTTIVLFASLGIGALYLLGGGSTKRFRNPGGKVVRGAKRAVRSPVRFVKKLAKKIGF